jgi:hypothetical protein
MNIKLHKKLVFARALIGITLLSGAPAWAESEASFNTWQNKLVPLYLWGVSMSGEMTTGPVTAPVVTEFEDTIGDLEGVFTLHYEGAKGNWGILADYSFLNLGISAAIPGTPASVDVDVENTVGELAGIYRFGADNPWQLIAGVRSYKLDVAIKGLPKTVTIDETLNDVFSGGRYIQSTNDKWTFLARGDVGTGDSDVVLNGVVLFDYRPKKLLSVLFGWRVLDYDADVGSGADRFKWDMKHTGPLLGLAFTW